MAEVITTRYGMKTPRVVCEDTSPSVKDHEADLPYRARDTSDIQPCTAHVFTSK